MKKFYAAYWLCFLVIFNLSAQKINVEAQVISINPNSYYGVEANNQWMTTHSIEGGTSKCDMVVFTSGQANGNTWRDLDPANALVNHDIDPATYFNHIFDTWEHDVGDECEYNKAKCVLEVLGKCVKMGEKDDERNQLTIPTYIYNLPPGQWHDSDIQVGQLKYKRKIKWELPVPNIPVAVDGLGSQYCSNKDYIQLETNSILPTEFSPTYVWMYNIGEGWKFLDETIEPKLNTLAPFVILSKNIYFKVAIKSNGVTGEFSGEEDATLNPPPPTNVNYTVNDVLCKGESTGAINVGKITGGISPYDFILERIPETGDNINFSTRSERDFYENTSITGLPYGDYKLTIRNSQTNGQCGIVMDIKINEPSTKVQFNPTAYTLSDYNSFNISCKGGNNGTITAYSSGGTGIHKYSLNGGNFQENPTFTGLSEGNYVLEVKDANDCPLAPLRKTVTLTAPPAITARQFISDYNEYGVSCFGINDGKIDIVAEGGTGIFQYSLNGGDFQENPFFEQLPAGSHYVVVKDNNECTYRLDTTLMQPSRVVIQDIKIIEPSCYAYENGSIYVQPSGGVTTVSGEKYKIVLFKNGIEVESVDSPEVTFSNIGTGSYTVKITDDNHKFFGYCIKDTTFFVGQPNKIDIVLPFNNRVTCKNGSDGEVTAYFSGGTAPYYVQWLNGNKEVIEEDTVLSHSVIKGLRAGFYSVQVKDKNYCSNGALGGWYIEDFEVKEPEILILSAKEELTTQISCQGADDGSVTLVAEGGWNIAPYKFSKDGISFVENRSLFEGLSSGSHTFYVKDALGCVAETQVDIKEPDTISIGVDDISMVKCNGGSDAFVRLSIKGGRPEYAITVSKGNMTWEDDSFIEGLSKGEYLIKVVDPNGCTNSKSVVITEPEKLEVSLLKKSNTTCGEANGSLTAGTIGGTPFYEYLWYNEANEVIGASETVSALGAGKYKVIVKDKNLCLDTLEIGISNIDGPKGEIINIQSVTCFGESNGSAEVKITGGVEPFRISGPNVLKNNKFSDLKSGTYLVEVIDGNNCKLYLDAVIPTPDPLGVKIVSNNKTNCFGGNDGSVIINGTGGTAPYSYFWDSGSRSNEIGGLSAGVYKFVIKDNNGCIYTDSVKVVNPEPLVVDLGQTEIICTGQTIRKDAGNPGSSYSWISNNGFRSTERIVDLNQSGVYVVTVTNENGCSDVDSLNLTVSSNLLKADILVASEAYEGDTVLLINISWPEQETFRWKYDTAVLKNKSDGIFEELIFKKTGQYRIGLSTRLGECEDSTSAVITILSRDQKPQENQRLANRESNFKEIKVYPNPSDGDFTASVVLEKEAPVHLRLIDALGTRLNQVKTGEGNSVYDIEFEIKGVLPGVYLLIIQSGDEVKTQRLIIR